MKKAIFMFLFVILFLFTSCNSLVLPGPLITKIMARLHGDSFDFSSSINEKNADTFLSVGKSKSDIYTRNQGGFDFLYTVSDSAGNISLVDSFGGAGNDVFIKSIATNDGGYILAGVTDSLSIKYKSLNLTGAHGNKDIILIKFDAGNNLLWHRFIGGSGNDNFGNIMEEKEYPYNLLLCGYTNSTDDDFSMNTDPSNYDGFVMSMESDGSTSQTGIYGGNSFDSINKVYKSGSIYYYIGETSSSDSYGWHPGYKSGVPTRDIWFIYTDSIVGTYFQSNCLGGSGDEFYCDSQDFGINSNFFDSAVCGVSDSIDFISTSKNYDAFVSRINFLYDGKSWIITEKWGNKFDYGNEDMPLRVLKDNKNNLNMVINSGNNIFSMESIENYSNYFLNISAGGTINSLRFIQNPVSTRIKSFIIINNEKFIFLGDIPDENNSPKRILTGSDWAFLDT